MNIGKRMCEFFVNLSFVDVSTYLAKWYFESTNMLKTSTIDQNNECSFTFKMKHFYERYDGFEG
jgi:5'-3' exonuclease